MKFLSIFGNSGAATRRKAPAKKVVDDGRLAMRKRQRLVDGFVWADNMLVARGCTIRDLSPVGAMVDLWHDHSAKAIREAPIPREIMLFIVPDRIEVDCEVTWRKEASLGLRFLGKFRPSTRQFGNR